MYYHLTIFGRVLHNGCIYATTFFYYFTMYQAGIIFFYLAAFK